MGQNRDAVIGFGIIIVIIAIIVGVVLAVTNTGETKPENDTKETAKDVSTKTQDTTEQKHEETRLDTRENILKFVQNYKGRDGSGATLVEILAAGIEVSYPDEDILNHPKTYALWNTLPNYGVDGSHLVTMSFRTYLEEVEYEWYVDENTGKVSAGNAISKLVLDVLDKFE